MGYQGILMGSRVWEPHLPSPTSSKEQQRKEPPSAVSVISDTYHSLSEFGNIGLFIIYRCGNWNPLRLKHSPRITQSLTAKLGLDRIQTSQLPLSMCLLVLASCEGENPHEPSTREGFQKHRVFPGKASSCSATNQNVGDLKEIWGGEGEEGCPREHDLTSQGRGSFPLQ